MLLSRSLPPHFLLPAWSTRQLLRALQRARKSTDASPNPQDPTIHPKIRFHESMKGWESSVQSRRGHKKLIPREEGSWSRMTIARVAQTRATSKDKQGVEGTSSAPSETTKPTSSVSSNLLDHKSPTWGLLDRAEPTRSTNSTKPVDGDRGDQSPKTTFSARPEYTEPTSSVCSKVPDEKSTAWMSLGRTEPAKSAEPVLDDEPAAKRTPRQRLEPWKRSGSLFDELFPEESKAAKQSEKKIVEKLPAFDWNAGPKIDWKETVEKAAEDRKNWFHTIPTANDYAKANRGKSKKDQLSVLVLSCASKTLEESDFFRLGSKGEHIEGWTSGIVKVIQGRDNNTLEPLGHYYLVFSNEVAASAYLDQTRRLHQLSKLHAGGRSTVPLSSKYLLPGEDVKNLLRGFSLVPGQSNLSLRLMSRPYSTAMEKVLNNGGPAAVARQRTNSEDMVLFSVERGQISHYDLQGAIFRDGNRRNLRWNLIDGEGSIVKISSDEQNEESEDAEDSSVTLSTRRRNTRSPSRYVLSFKDPHEARRFVREWHLRPFPVNREKKVGDKPPPIMNVEMFW